MTTLYENELYTVSINDSLDGYDVTNLATKIIEYKTEMLPDAYNVCDALADGIHAKLKSKEMEASAPKATPPNMLQ